MRNLGALRRQGFLRRKLSPVFNEAAALESAYCLLHPLPQDEYHSSVLRFEKHYNITGLSENWVYPENQTAEEFIDFAWRCFDPLYYFNLQVKEPSRETNSAYDLWMKTYFKDDMHDLVQLNDLLTAMNPGLNVVQRNKTDVSKEIDFLYGVAYKFPRLDIVYKATINRLFRLDEFFERCKIEEQIVKRLSAARGVTHYSSEYQCGWVLSDNTLERLNQTVRQLELSSQNCGQLVLAF